MVSLSDDFRKTVYDLLAERMIQAIETEEVDYDEAQKSAGYVVDNLDKITTEEELYLFLDELVTRWAFYKTASSSIKDQQIDLKEQAMSQEDAQKISQVQDKLNQFMK